MLRCHCIAIALLLHCCSIAVALLLCCRCVAVALPLHCCCVAVALPLRCCCIAVPLPLRCHYVAIVLLLHCHCIAVVLPLRCRCLAVVLLLRCRCIAVALLLCCRCVAVTSLECFHRITVPLPSRWCCTAVHPARPWEPSALLGTPPSLSPRAEGHRGLLSWWLFLVAAKPGRGGRPVGLSAGARAGLLRISPCTELRKLSAAQYIALLPVQRVPSITGRAGTRRLHHGSTPCRATSSRPLL